VAVEVFRPTADWLRKRQSRQRWDKLQVQPCRQCPVSDGRRKKAFIEFHPAILRELRQPAK
jgi:hypothetical protein